jgi:DNA-binding CsgD family transcriptional regulator
MSSSECKVPLAEFAAEIANDAAAGLLRRLSFGVLFVDAGGLVTSLNQAAERIIEAADGLTLQEGILTPARAFEQAKLSQALAEIARHPSAGGHSFIIGRPARRLGYAILIMPLSTEQGVIVGAGLPTAMILVTDFDLRPQIGTGMLNELFGFTEAQARLATALAQGKTLRQIAAETGQALPTLRAHLSAMFEKTGVKRQADIIRLVLSVPAIQS